MDYRIRYIKEFQNRSKVVWAFLFFFLLSLVSSAQVTSSVDTTKIKIGEQITYKLEVETDSTKIVVFPQAQQFSPLEVIESYPVDTTKLNDKLKLIKKYGLTQFDSGTYYIPAQKINIALNTFTTDSVKVEVNTIEVDTTKQGLYDIKPLIQVEKPQSNWLKYLAIVLSILALVGFLLYWFIWRPKPLTEEEKIALLPPYDRAKLALKKLDESHYLENKQIKEYYSELTFAIRKYLDEKVYDKALESTTDELVSRLNLLKDGNQYDLSKDTIKNIESILKRADLVKFAKSAPDVELAKLDRNTVDVEIDHVKEVLPEPTEEEKLLDEKYRQELEKKKKRRKIILTLAIVLGLLLATYSGFGIKYGFGYVNDTLIGHQGKKLLERTWVTSDYGFPPVTISTPEVLKRTEIPLPDELKDKVKNTTFSYEKEGVLMVMISSTLVANPQDSLDMKGAIEGSMKLMESRGAKNILTKDDKFTTPNGAEGVKTHGTMDFPLKEGSEKEVKVNYYLFTFTSENKVLQQIIFIWRQNDDYTDKIVERMENSIELQQKTD